MNKITLIVLITIFPYASFGIDLFVSLELDILLRIFHNCIIHLNTYQPPKSLHPDSTVNSTEIHYEIKPPPIPLIRSLHYVYESVINGSLTYSVTGKNFNESGNSTDDVFVFSPKIINLLCFAKLYLVQGTLIEKIIRVDAKHNRGYHDIVYPTVSSLKNKPIPYDNIMSVHVDYINLPRYKLPKYNGFQILLSDSSTVLTNSSWFKTMRPPSPVSNFQFNFASRLTLFNVNSTSAFSTVESLILVSKVGLYMEHKIRKYDSITHHNFSEALERLYLTTPLFREQFIEVDANAMTASMLHNLTVGINKKLLSGKTFHFLHYETWMDAGILLVNLAFKNCTLIEFWDTFDNVDIPILGTVWLDGNSGSAMYVDDAKMQFITCDGIEEGHISILGYFSAFDMYTWIFLFGIASASAIVLNITQIKENDEKGFTVWLPLTVLFEQGVDIGKRMSSTFILTVWLLTGIVISNAYRGQNITDLSSPVPPVPLKTFLDLTRRNFTLYSVVDDVFDVDAWGWLKQDENETFEDMLDGNSNSPAFFELLRNPRNPAFAKEISKHVHVYTEREMVKNIYGQSTPEAYLNFITVCSKTAYVTWSNEIPKSELILKRLMREKSVAEGSPNSPKKLFRTISRSEQALFSQAKSWNVVNLEVPAKIVFQRIAAILESGIAHHWHSWEQRVQSFNDTVLIQQLDIAAPQKLNMTDNIVVVFYAHFVFLLLAAIFLVVEIISGLVVGFSIMKGFFCTRPQINIL